VSLRFLGYDGGAGIGSGPGMAVGAALALHGRAELPVAILGDGDLLMAPAALWTAAHHGIPLLVVVANNQTYQNDEVHQTHMAITRGRPVENHWVGLRLDQPPVDFAALANSLGVEGLGPVERGRGPRAVFPTRRARRRGRTTGSGGCTHSTRIIGPRDMRGGWAAHG